MNPETENPFEGLKIDSHEPLHNVTSRTKCPECNASRKYFCYQCYVMMPELAGTFQTVKLPLKVDIIKHHLELDGKSTAIHARLLAPDHVTIYTYPDMPDYEHVERVLLVFPCEDAVSLEELVKQSTSSKIKAVEQDQSDLVFNQTNNCTTQRNSTKPSPSGSQTDQNNRTYCCSNLVNHKCTLDDRLCHITNGQTSVKGETSLQGSDYPMPSSEPANLRSMSSEDLHRLMEAVGNDKGDLEEQKTKKIKNDAEEGMFDRVIFIDSTWYQCGSIFRDERLAGIKRVVIRERKTTFWRPQHRKPQMYLSTIEAIYYFLMDYHKIVLGKDYEGQYDNLLFFYSFFHGLVHKKMQERDLHRQEGKTQDIVDGT